MATRRDKKTNGLLVALAASCPPLIHDLKHLYATEYNNGIHTRTHRQTHTDDETSQFTRKQLLTIGSDCEFEYRCAINQNELSTKKPCHLSNNLCTFDFHLENQMTTHARRTLKTSHTHTHTHNSESLRSDMPPGWILPSRIIRTTTHTSINCTMRKHCM